MVKRAKYQDRDRYYRLAKEQGFRARSAFKLIQINRKHDFLSKAKVCIDLCAAPGGWCQVAAKTMPNKAIIVGVDLLPIRSIPHVKTLVADITTADCREKLRRELQGWRADVVLCDGAPNVGAAFVKDAYVQNELVLAALKTATEHLVGGGTFLTKVYRSRDYNKLLFVLNQLFEEVKPIKPSSSRQASAETFLLCSDYRNPSHIDPRLLDPAHVFAMVDGEQGGPTGITIFHKSYNSGQRRRQGYDAGATALLTTVVSATDFVESTEPVQLLSDASVIRFTDAEADQALQGHELTTDMLREYCADLKVLGKGEFKALLKWRLRLRKAQEEVATPAAADGVDAAADAAGTDAGSGPPTEEQIQQEIQSVYEDLSRKRKREKKKKREKMAKARDRAALGMDHVAFDLPDHDSMFNLRSATHDDQPRAAARQMDPLEAMNAFEAVHSGHLEAVEEDEDEERNAKRRMLQESPEELEEMEEALDAVYEAQLKRKSADRAAAAREEADEALKKSRKRSNQKKIALAGQQAQEDASMYDGDASEYARQLGGGSDSDDDEDDDGDDDDGDDTDGDDSTDEDRGGDGAGRADDENDALGAMAAVGGRGAGASRARPGSRGEESESDDDLLTGIPAERIESAAGWFENPLFQRFQDNLEDLDSEVSLARLVKTKRQQAHERKRQREEAMGPMSEAAEHKSEPEGMPETAQSVLDSIPRTDKEVRAERRRRLQERKERRTAKKLRLDNVEPGVEVVPRGQGAGDVDLSGANLSSADVLDDPSLTAEEKRKLLAKRDLIRRGMGAGAGEDADTGGVEVVASDAMTIRDDRVYDSDHEAYDNEDHVRHLALGAMMLRKGRAKTLVDASYNRFAWNDQPGLPDWFKDDEERHHRPQVPIPRALMEQMREKYVSLASKPIKKVAEARARKQKRAQMKLKAARDKADRIMGNDDLSERAKLRTIQATMAKARKKESKGGPKKVTVSRKFQGGKGAKGKGLKVDRRQKSDLAGMKRAEKRNSKRRR